MLKSKMRNALLLVLHSLAQPAEQSRAASSSSSQQAPAAAGSKGSAAAAALLLALSQMPILNLDCCCRRVDKNSLLMEDDIWEIRTDFSFCGFRCCHYVYPIHETNTFIFYSEELVSSVSK